MADLSTDSADITADLIEQTPIEKCSLNPRRGRNSRRLLTGFIIYASEVRKEVVEKYPDQNFGFISKLVGDKWRDLHTDLRFKYHQRALIHNKRIKELAAREGVSLGDIDLANGSVIKAPKVAKKSKKAEKEAKRRANESSNSTTPNPDKSSLSPDTMGMMKMNGISNLSYSNDIGVGGHFQATAVTPAMSKGYSSHPIKYAESHQHVQSAPTRPRKVCTVDSATQTPCIRYIEPPPKKPLKYSEPFLKRLEEIRQQLLIASHVAPVVHNYLSA